MQTQDIGAWLNPQAGGATTAVAAGAGDNTEVDGPWIDRQGYESAMVVISYQTTLTAAKTLSLASNIQDATDSSGTGAADFGGAATGPSGGSEIHALAVAETGAGTDVQGVVSYRVNLRTANRYIRAQFTPDLSNTATDVADVACVIILGGAQELPVS